MVSVVAVQVLSSTGCCSWSWSRSWLLLLLMLMLETDEENASVGRVVAASSVVVMTVNRDMIEMNILIFFLFYEKEIEWQKKRRVK